MRILALEESVKENITSKRVCKYFVKVVDVTPTGFADGLTTFYRDVTPTGLKRKQVKNRRIPPVLKGHKIPSDVECQKLYTPSKMFRLTGISICDKLRFM